MDALSYLVNCLIGDSQNLVRTLETRDGLLKSISDGPRNRSYSGCDWRICVGVAYIKPPREVIQLSPAPIQVQVQTPTAQPSPLQQPNIESAHATFDRREVVGIPTPEPRVQVAEPPSEPTLPVEKVNETHLATVVPPNPVLSPVSSALLFATQVGDHDAVKRSLESGANPNAVSDDGKTPLIRAAENGHHDICKTLVLSGALTTMTDQRSRNALHYAAEAGHNDLVQYLLENGTRAEAVDNEGSTPLALAARGAHNTCANMIREFLRGSIR